MQIPFWPRATDLIKRAPTYQGIGDTSNSYKLPEEVQIPLCRGAPYGSGMRRCINGLRISRRGTIRLMKRKSPPWRRCILSIKNAPMHQGADDISNSYKLTEKVRIPALPLGICSIKMRRCIDGAGIHRKRGFRFVSMGLQFAQKRAQIPRCCEPLIWSGAAICARLHSDARRFRLWLATMAYQRTEGQAKDDDFAIRKSIADRFLFLSRKAQFSAVLIRGIKEGGQP